MPNKTIYVSDDDLPLFQRAQELAGGNLSSTIARALRRFVTILEADMQGFEEVTVRVGKGGGRQRKRFLGRRVAQWRHGSGEDEGIEVFVVYRTAKGRYALHTRRLPGLSYWNDPMTWFEPYGGDDVSWDAGEYSLEVFETFGELEGAVPPELAQLVRENEQERPLEELDI
jgi:EXLDI family protein